MWTNTRRLGILGFIVLCLSIWFFSIYASADTYELRPEITVPEYRTDAARAIDAYERMMNRYMGLTERSLSGMNTDVKIMLRKLEAMDVKLNALTTRISRIEKALGIEIISVIEPPKNTAAPEKDTTKPVETSNEVTVEKTK